MDPLVDNAATEETKAKLKELDRLVEFGVYKTVDLHVALWKSEWRHAGCWTTEKTESQYDSSRESSRVTKRCMMCWRQTRRWAQDASLTTWASKKYRQQMRPTRTSTWTKTKNATWTHRLNGWTAGWIGGRLDGDCEKKLYGRRRAATRWVDFMAERQEEQSFDRCDAAPQFLAIYELDVFMEAHMDDLHGTGPKPALDRVQTNLSQKVHFKVWTVHEMAWGTNTSNVSECCTTTGLRSWPTQNTCEECCTAWIGNLQTSNDTNCSGTRQTESWRWCWPGHARVQTLLWNRWEPAVLVDTSLWRQFGMNACVKEMKRPTKASRARLKRWARYLAGTQSATISFHSWILEQTTAHMKRSYESGQTVFDWGGLGVPRTGKVKRVWKSKWMDVRCTLHYASRKHAHTQVAKLSTTSIGHQWGNVDPRRLVVHGFGSSDWTPTGQCSSTWHLQTRRCGNNTCLPTKVLWLPQWVKSGVLTVGARTSEENLADLVTKSLLVHKLRQLRQLNGLALYGTDNSANGDGEDGQDENGQHVAAVQTISNPGNVPGSTTEPGDGSSWDEVSIVTWMLDAMWQVAHTLNNDRWSGALRVRKNGLSRGHTSVWADDLRTVAGNGVSARNAWRRREERFDLFLHLWLNPTRCFSAVQTALLSCTSADNWTSRVEGACWVENADADVVAHARQMLTLSHPDTSRSHNRAKANIPLHPLRRSPHSIIFWTCYQTEGSGHVPPRHRTQSLMTYLFLWLKLLRISSIK